MAGATPARERIIQAFFRLLREKSYQKITVSSLLLLARVNRSTFYRNFENIDDLMECVTDESLKSIAVEPPFPVSGRDDLERYARVMFDNAQERREEVALLCGKNGNMLAAYRIASAVRDRLADAIDAAGITDPAVKRVAEMASPQLSFYFMAGDLPKKTDGVILKPVIRYDKSLSMLENVSRYLEKSLGGSEYFHYDLLCAYVKTDAKKADAYRNISVSELLATAGIHRTEFYKYYKNIADFFERFENACVYTALYWVAGFFDSGQMPTEEELSDFIKNDDVRVSINKFFVHGRITDYFPKVLNLALLYVDSLIPGGLTEDRVMEFSYYISEFAYAICTYLVGMTDYAELKKTLDHLKSVQKKYGV